VLKLLPSLTITDSELLKGIFIIENSLQIALSNANAACTTARE
jgi:4-aminobutyrate aminotransferase-like enzyme